MPQTNKLNIIYQAKTPVLLIGETHKENLTKIFRVSIEDFMEINGEPIKITEIRALTHFLNFKPFNSQFKLAVITSADNMTLEASNALLKTLEEPPTYAKIILTTLCEQRILPTISSRCQKVRTKAFTDFLKPADYLEPSEIAKINISERFNWAAKISDSENVQDILTLWQDYFRQKLLQDEDVLEILSEISKAKDLLKTNISVKLLLENILLLF